MKVDKKLKHLIDKCGFEADELGEIKKMYSGEFFDPNDVAYQKLLKMSKDLCDQYNAIDQASVQNPSIFKTVKTYFQRKKIIDKLFPQHGFISGMNSGLDVVIGQVDLGTFNYINKSVKFSKYTLVDCGSNTLFGVKIDVGSDIVEKKGNLIRLSKINIGKNSWICAGVKIDNNVNIGNGSVVGAGAFVKGNVPDDCLFIGRPGKVFAKLDVNYSSKGKLQSNYTDEQIKIIVANLRKVGYTGSLTEYLKALNCENFNVAKIKFGGLFLLTHRLCGEYNNKNTSSERKQQILDIIFPIHGKNFTVGGNLYVDLLGTTIVGDNVTIGDGVCIAGNVQLKDNVKVGNDVSLFASGHELLSKCRKPRFSLKNGIYEYTKSDVITVEPNIEIENGTVVVPSTIVKQNIPENSLCTNSKIITACANSSKEDGAVL